jgi:transposase-like protein
MHTATSMAPWRRLSRSIQPDNPGAALKGRLPKVCESLERAEENIQPITFWRKLRSTNPLEQLNREWGGAQMSPASSPTTHRCCP